MKTQDKETPIVVAVDCALVTKDRCVVLIRRGTEPFKSKLAFPGGKIEPSDQTLAYACAREVGEELGLNIDPASLQLLTLLDTPGRDPRPGMRISIVFWAVLPVGSTFNWSKREVEWIELCPLDNLIEKDIAFDHHQALCALKAII